MNENKPRRRAHAARAAQKSAYRKSGLSRIVLMVTMMALVAVVSIGGTLAWLQAETDEVVNTFKTNGISASITEEGATKVEGENKYTQEFEIIPGVNITKKPTVSATSTVDCYVFVEVIPKNWPMVTEKDSDAKKINYSVDSYWTALEGYANVYYKELTVPADANEVKIENQSVLTNNVVTVSNTLTKEEMAEIKESVSLSFKAYAMQKDEAAGEIFTAVEAWEVLFPPATEPTP